MGKVHLFQVECWAIYPSGNYFFCFMAKGKLGKEMDFGFGKEKRYFWHISYVNNGN